MKKLGLFFLLLHGPLIFSQHTWEHYMLMGNDSLKKHPVYTETILDAAVPIMQDTTFWPETQRLRIVFGDVLEGLLGLRWEAIHLKRTKLVGQSAREVSPYDGPLTKEYDINFFLVPHLPHYVDTVANWWARAGKEGRNLFHSIIDDPQITIPDKLKMGNWYLYVECENTPIKSKRPIMDSLFFPCKKNTTGLSGHPSFGNTYTCMGLYGPAVMDCNHSCKPEVHPYEWIWWLKPDSTHSTLQQWYIGLHRDWSGRFRDWSTSPRVGTIKIPFLLKAGKAPSIRIDLLAYDEFLTASYEPYFDDAIWLPSQSFNTELLKYSIHIEVTGVPENSVKYRFYNSSLVTLHGEKYIKGWLELGVAVKNLAEWRVVYDPQQN
jgi:hypothetical protein